MKAKACMKSREGGITIALVAIFIVVLFIIAALVIDLGVLYTARTSAQQVADAAALAGAYTFLNPVATQPTAAQNAAINIAAQNSILGTPVSIAGSDVVVDTGNQMVTVTVSRLGSSGVSTFFANIIGIKAVDVQTKATAQVSKRATGTFCVRPFWLPNDVLGSCTKGQELFDANGEPTSYAVSQLGSQISLWYKVAPSQWSLWDPSPYGTDFSTAMQSCINAAGGNVPVKCGDTLTTDNGAKVGQVLPAVQNLLGPNPDTYIAIGQYQDGVTGQIKDTSPQLASV
ncbi:MAG: hypothetical protein JO187_09460, partial [Acidobacteria bacterium]|nr:hypothetical protein [Acidobacteriota bacterium]